MTTALARSRRPDGSADNGEAQDRAAARPQGFPLDRAQLQATLSRGGRVLSVWLRRGKKRTLLYRTRGRWVREWATAGRGIMEALCRISPS